MGVHVEDCVAFKPSRDSLAAMSIWLSRLETESMAWNRWFALRSYLRSSLWVAPFFALVSYMIVVRVLDWIGTGMAA
jgi:hypothetical protein